MKFPYIKLPNKDRSKKAFSVPWIPVSIKANDNGQTFLMLVDSGADNCILDKDIADFLGLNLKDGDLDITQGIGGPEKIYYFDNIWLNIGGHEIPVRAGFISGKLLKGRISGVLGRQGFFDYFKVSITQSKNEIELTPTRRT